MAVIQMDICFIAAFIMMGLPISQAFAFSCPRYLTNSCQGPFTIRPAAPTPWLSPKTCVPESAAMQDCLLRCMHDLCCRAFGLHNGNCTMVNFHTEALDFVKEAHSWPVKPETCMNGTGCIRTLGLIGEHAFSFHQTFLNASTDLRAIGMGFDVSPYLVRLEFDYGGGVNASHVIGVDVETYRCTLDVGEYVTRVTGHFTLYGVCGIELTTSRRTCGPYGKTTLLKQSVGGDMLVSLAGKAGTHFTKLDFIFNSCP